MWKDHFQTARTTVRDERTRLSELTINGLRLAKDFVHANDGDVS